MTRKYTNRLLEMIDDGLLDAYDVVMMALSYMSESDVRDMTEVNDLELFREEEENDSRESFGI